MINRYDNFSKLEEIVVGSVNYSMLDVVDKNDKQFFKDILDGQALVFLQLEKILEQFGVKVHRPIMFDHSKLQHELGIPFHPVNYVYSSISPYDNFLTIENAVIEMTSSSPSSVHDHVQYQHIWKEKFDQGSRWLSMPRPSYSKIHEQELPNNEPYADGPSFLLLGDTVFVTEQYCVNSMALDWFKREFPNFKFKIFENTKGHLDSYFAVIRPGLAISGLDKNQLPKEFENWEILEFGKEDYSGVEFRNEAMQDNDYENTTLAVNTLVIDENNIVVIDSMLDTHRSAMRKLESKKVNLIPLKYDVCRWTNQGIACITNPIRRQGTYQNYF
jgi:hypothetical protein